MTAALRPAPLRNNRVYNQTEFKACAPPERTLGACRDPTLAARRDLTLGGRQFSASPINRSPIMAASTSGQRSTTTGSAPVASGDGGSACHPRSFGKGATAQPVSYRHTVAPVAGLPEGAVARQLRGGCARVAG